LKGETAMAEYRCQECGATFDTQADREQHNRIEHSQYMCDECGDVLTSEDELDVHAHMEHPETQGQRR
jgi:DNA-directed RNA polymerase subunit RPC12/RpoP